jgi:RNA polymerase sigma-70 factor (ECF subfamily)
MRSDGQEDRLLIDRVKEGDRQALDDIIRKHEKRAYQYAFRLTRNQDEASDVVAEAFVRVSNALPNFKGQSAFTTWLYRIVTNCFLDIRKREQSRKHVSLEQSMQLEGGEVERQVEDEGQGPDELAERNAREQAVQSALTDMPEYQRAMLVMYHVERLSYEDIAEALDLPLGTVKSRLNRARVALRERLGDQLELFQLG